jgi:hypothetical protein
LGAHFETEAPRAQDGEAFLHESFSPEHKRAVKDAAGSVLIEWDYETDDDW